MTYRDTPSMRRLAQLPSPLASPEDCAIARVDVERVVGRLPERERAVVEARMLGERGRTQREVGAMFNRSLQWARMVEARAVWRMAWDVVAPGSEAGRWIEGQRARDRAWDEVWRRMDLVREVRR